MRLLLALLVLLPLVAACSGSADLPALPPCAAATPIPQTRRERDNNQRYAQAVVDGANTLNGYLANFRAQWPNGTFYRSSDFRQSFVDFEGSAGCLADNLASIAIVPTVYAGIQGSLKEVLSAYQAALQDGHDAIATRNVSDYRDWNKAMDDLTGRLNEVVGPLTD